MTTPDSALLSITADIVSAHVGNNIVAVSDLPILIDKVYAALTGLGVPAPPPAATVQEPVVSRRASIKPDYLICLEDGKKCKVLKRHLAAKHQLTPEAYRTKWQLPDNYPMVASSYRETRKAVALSIGLGRNPVQPEPASETSPAPEPEAAVGQAAPAARVRHRKLKPVP